MFCYLEQKRKTEVQSQNLNIIWVLNPMPCTTWGLNEPSLLPVANDIQDVRGSLEELACGCSRISSCAKIQTYLSPLSQVGGNPRENVGFTS